MISQTKPVRERQRNPRPRGVDKKNRELIRAYRGGDEDALSELLSFNMSHFKNLAKAWATSFYPLEEDDIVQDCCIGTLRALKNWDEERDSQFMTFARFYMYGETERDAQQNQLIGLPDHMYKLLRKFDKHNPYLSHTYNNEQVMDHAGRMNMNTLRIEEILRTRHQCYNIMLDEEGYPRKNASHDMEEIAQSYDLSDEITIDQMGKRVIMIAFEKLTERERLILSKRYGLDGKGARTLEEVNRELHLGISRDRVRQLEAQALAKIRRRLWGKQYKDIREWLQCM